MVNRNLEYNYKTQNYQDFNDNTFWALKERIEELPIIFDDKECLELDVVMSELYCKDFMFLLDNNNVMSIRANRVLNCPGDIILTVNIVNAEGLKCHVFPSSVFGEQKCLSGHPEVFTFVDSNQKPPLGFYYLNDKLKSYQDRDVKDILKTLSIEEFTDRIINSESILNSKQQDQAKVKKLTKKIMINY